MSRFQASNPSQYGVQLDAEQVSSLIDAGAGLVSAVSDIIPDKKKSGGKKKGGGTKPAAKPTRPASNPAPVEKKSNTALWVAGGVGALVLVGGGIWLARR
jgi:hypothetical protein